MPISDVFVQNDMQTRQQKALDARQAATQKAMSDRAFMQDMVRSKYENDRLGLMQEKIQSPDDKQAAINGVVQYAPPELQPILKAAGAKGANPALIDMAYKALSPAFGSTLYNQHFFNTTSVDPNGITTTTPYRATARGGPASPVMTGGAAPTPDTSGATTPATPMGKDSLGPTLPPPTPETAGGVTSPAGPAASRPLTSMKPNAAMISQLQAVSQTEQLAQNLSRDVLAIQDASPMQLASQWAKYRAPFGALGAADPNYSAYFNDLGQIQTALVAAATQGNSRAFRLIEMLKPHIPSPTDPPARAMEKLRGFERGRFQAIRQMISGGGGGAVSPAGADSGAASRPQIGTTPDGKPVYRLPNGKMTLEPG